MHDFCSIFYKPLIQLCLEQCCVNVLSGDTECQHL